jgi:hypothetical protein
VLNLAPGDFDRNGVVNAADLEIWKANNGLKQGALLDKGDADMDGDVDARDFLAWQRSVGATTTPISSVPEPGAVMLALAALGAARVLLRRAR